MTDAETAWLACAVDGEGIISRNSAGGRNGQYQSPYLAVVNTCLAFVVRCREITACGTIVEQGRQERRAKDIKPCWRWQVYRQRDIFFLLQQIEPHLIVKREKARTFLRQFRDVDGQ